MSLLDRLKSGDDRESWQEFLDAYGGLIFGVAIKAGLSEQDAQDVVQDTVVTVARNLKNFETDPTRGSFKAWLLKTARWRIINQFKKRRPEQIARAHRAHDDTRQTATVERIPNPGKTDLDSLWDAEWEAHVMQTALERLKLRVKAKHFQIFFLHVCKGQPVRDVARSLGVNVALVYLVKHRLGPQLRREIRRLDLGVGSNGSMSVKSRELRAT